MTVHFWQHGNPAVVLTDGSFAYANDPAPFGSKSCPRCGRMPTPEGHDACLGWIPGVRSACCGHGVEETYYVDGGGILHIFGKEK